MKRYILKRLVISIITIWLIATCSFFLLHALPGTPFGTTQLMSQEMRDKMMAYYGLDRPPLEQYLTFLSNLIRGDFGYSLKYVGQSVNGIIAQTFPVSLRHGGVLEGRSPGICLRSGPRLPLLAAGPKGTRCNAAGGHSAPAERRQ